MTPEETIIILTAVSVIFVAATSVFGYLTWKRIPLRKSRSIQESFSRKFGLRNLWRERRDVDNKEWFKFLDSANYEIDLLATVYHNYMTDAGKFFSLMEKKKNCTIRILILDPSSEIAKIMEREGRENLADNITNALNNMKQHEFMKDLVKLHQKTDVFSITRVDNLMRVTSYIPFLSETWSGEASPTMELYKTNGGLFSKYMEHFDKLWQSSTVTLDDWIKREEKSNV